MFNCFYVCVSWKKHLCLLALDHFNKLELSFFEKQKILYKTAGKDQIAWAVTMCEKGSPYG